MNDRASRPSIAKPCSIAALAAASVALLAPSVAQSSTTWLCRPGMTNNVCASSQKTTTVQANGTRSVATPSIPKSPKVDCFYVYPTTSDQKSPIANFTITPELRAIALNQAAPYSQACKVYAPVYRQVTIQGLLGTATVTAAMRETAYADVLAAWKDYLNSYNRGRGVILVGHSQGTFMLRRLIAEEIDGKRSVRRKLVAAHLTGGNVLVAKGSDRGGDFRNIPACRSRSQTGCVIAYSAFNAAVPDNSRFGRFTPVASWDPGGEFANREVLCTNPANLTPGGNGGNGGLITPGGNGGRGGLFSLNSTSPFPGTIGLGIALLHRTLPTGVTTPWVRQNYLFSAQCVTSNGANVLMVTSLTDQRPLTASPDPSWGLHLADMNIAMGNLISLAKSQASAWR
ncbi:MAG: DUF3089 domain-containing protein [Actinomycetes bacterium]